ncbi:MAG: NAD(P)H-dependent oxidoreductase subunit E [Clostridiales bacterium]|jgi:NADH:ubiquinone oxidoreductase subunit E|nr:NAD(P)H-dependent oxidoreductase subunit E [Clostridiales bacterium]
MANECNCQNFSELDEFIDSLESKNGSLITVLHKAQDIYGYLPSEVQMHIARKLDIPASKVYGVVTFYSFFDTEPKGKYKINVCLGTACFVRGSQAILDEFSNELKIGVGQTTDDKLFSLDSVRCVGACGLAPVVSVNGKIYGRVTTDEVRNIVEEYMAKD